MSPFVAPFKRVSQACLLYLLAAVSLADTVNTSARSTQATIIRHPVAKHAYFKQRDSYFLQVLQLALENSNLIYRLQGVTLPPMSESRSNKYLQSQRYDVHWLMTNNHHEKTLRPIRIPLYKGLIGWRLLLIRADRQGDFTAIESLQHLKTLRAVQGLDWPDSAVLRSNGFNLRTSLQRARLIDLVVDGHADYFPRSVTEIWQEADGLKGTHLAVEQRLALHYPAAYYFFLSRQNAVLASAIEQGLNRAIQNGSFDALFNRVVGLAVQRSRLPERSTFHINNPQLPPATPLSRKELWYLVPGTCPD